MINTKSIRFKLTVWYALWLFFISLIFIFLMNMVLLRVNASQRFRKHFDQVAINRSPIMEKEIENLPAEYKKIMRGLRDEDIKRIRSLSLYSVIPILLISIGGGYLIAGYMLSPIKDLNDRISKISADRLGETIDFEDNGDEIAELIKNFNKMSLRLGQSFELQKQFVEDASHELKTPLAIFQTNLEAMNKQNFDKYRDKALDSVGFMNNLIEDLLLLSLTDKQLKFSEVEVGLLTKSVLEQLFGLAEEKNIDIKLDYELDSLENVKLYCNKNLLERALFNLIENAIKYSAVDTEVIVNVSQVNNRLAVEIRDRGEGIPEKDLPYIFNRFYRVDKSRSRKTGGNGLGLSIVEKIVSLHNGEIKVDSIEGSGSKFTVLLPIYTG